MTAPPIKNKSLKNCRAKRRYADELAARAAGMDALHRYHNAPCLYVYQCQHCHGWHLTRRAKHSPAVLEHNPIAEAA